MERIWKGFGDGETRVQSAITERCSSERNRRTGKEGTGKAIEWESVTALPTTADGKTKSDLP